MALRKIGEMSNEDTQKRAVIYRDAEWNEYRIQFHFNGQYQENADYHTDDKHEAFTAAQYIINRKGV